MRRVPQAAIGRYRVSEGARILIISDYDEVIGPLTATLRRDGYRVGISSSQDGPEELRATRRDLR